MTEKEMFVLPQTSFSLQLDFLKSNNSRFGQLYTQGATALLKFRGIELVSVGFPDLKSNYNAKHHGVFLKVDVEIHH